MVQHERGTEVAVKKCNLQTMKKLTNGYDCQLFNDVSWQKQAADRSCSLSSSLCEVNRGHPSVSDHQRLPDIRIARRNYCGDHSRDECTDDAKHLHEEDWERSTSSFSDHGSCIHRTHSSSMETLRGLGNGLYFSSSPPSVRSSIGCQKTVPKETIDSRGDVPAGSDETNWSKPEHEPLPGLHLELSPLREPQSAPVSKWRDRGTRLRAHCGMCHAYSLKYESKDLEAAKSVNAHLPHHFCGTHETRAGDAPSSAAVFPQTCMTNATATASPSATHEAPSKVPDQDYGSLSAQIGFTTPVQVFKDRKRQRGLPSDGETLKESEIRARDTAFDLLARFMGESTEAPMRTDDSSERFETTAFPDPDKPHPNTCSRDVLPIFRTGGQMDLATSNLNYVMPSRSSPQCLRDRTEYMTALHRGPNCGFPTLSHYPGPPGAEQSRHPDVPAVPAQRTSGNLCITNFDKSINGSVDIEQIFQGGLYNTIGEAVNTMYLLLEYSISYCQRHIQILNVSDWVASEVLGEL